MIIQTHVGESLKGTNKGVYMGTEVGMWKQNEKRNQGPADIMLASDKAVPEISFIYSSKIPRNYFMQRWAQ